MFRRGLRKRSAHAAKWLAKGDPDARSREIRVPAREAFSRARRPT